jgi:hypothetical protein
LHSSEFLVESYLSFYSAGDVLILVALAAAYPEHTWKTKDHKSIGYWKDIKNQRSFFDVLAVKLNVKKPEDWYSVRLDTVLMNGGSFIISYYNGSVRRGIVYISLRRLTFA